MPAIDNLFGNGAIHITDRNKAQPLTTLCGQALDKDTIRYFEDRDNFDQATCKVCRKSFFDEEWTGMAQAGPPEIVKTETTEEILHRKNLFNKLKPPVNAHGKQTVEKEIPNGD